MADSSTEAMPSTTSPSLGSGRLIRRPRRRNPGFQCWLETVRHLIPSDGEVVEGIASVDESAITGESAPVIRESGGDRSAVTGGTRVLSDWIKVRITAAQGSTFLDRNDRAGRGAERQKTPNEIALNILLAGLTIIFVFAVVTIPSFAATRAVRCPWSFWSRCSSP